LSTIASNAGETLFTTEEGCGGVSSMIFFATVQAPCPVNG